MTSVKTKTLVTPVYSQAYQGKRVYGAFARFVAFFVLALFLLPLFFLTRANTAHVSALPSDNLNFQARLETSTGSIAADGYYNLEFKLYSASIGGTALWTETYTGANKVRVANGYITVNLGSVTAFPSTMPWDQQLYLTMNVGGTSVTPSWDGEMNPRLKLTAVPYAMNAKTASQLLASNGGFNTTIGFSGTATGNIAYYFDATATPGNYTVCTTAGNCSVSGGSGSYIQNSYGTSNIQSNADFNINGIGTANEFVANTKITVGSATTQGEMVLHAGNGFTTTLKAGASAAGISFTLPTGYGSANQCLLTDGAGQMSWGSCTGAGGSGVNAVGTINSQPKSADGAVISGSTIYMQTADGTYPGLISVGAQTLGGAKTFTSLITGSAGASITGGINNNNGGITNAGTITGATGLTASGTITFSGLNSVGIVTTNASGVLSTGVLNRNSSSYFNTALSVANGGTGATTAAGARTNLGAAAAGANSDITSLSGLTTALSVGQGGTGAATVGAAGTVAYSNGTNYAFTAAGTSGECLTSNGAGAPTWGSCTAGAGGTTMGGDVTGTVSANTVSKLQGTDLTITSAAANQTLVYDGTAWKNSLLANANLAAGAYSNITGVGTITSGTWQGTAVGATYGGTGLTSVTTGDLLVGGASNTFTKLAAVAAGQCLLSNGVSTAPTWGSCSAAAGGANTSLSNLTATALNQSLIAGTNNNLDLGSSSLAWRNGYFGTAVYGPYFDTASAGALNLGTTNANALTIGKAGVTTTVNGTVVLSSLTAGLVQSSAGGTLSSGSVDRNSSTFFNTALAVTNGGTGSTTAAGARTNLGAAASGANSDITSLTGLTTDLSVAQGGTGASTFTANGVLYGNGTSALQATAASTAAGQCLITVTAGAAPTWGTCTGDGVGLTAEADTLQTVTGRGAITTVASTFQGGATIRGITVDTATVTQDRILISAAATGAARFDGTITNADLTAARTWTLPNASGTIAVSASGNIALSATGNITFTGTLGAANGGTGNTTYTTNGSIYYDGTKFVSTAASTAAGQCLLTVTAGAAPTWGTCTGDGVGITSEADTLATVTGRGATTATASTFSGGLTASGAGTGLTVTNNATIGGTLGVTGATTLSGTLNANGNTTIGNATTDRLTLTAQLLGGAPIVFQGATDNGFATTLALTDPTANNTITLPNASGTVALLGAIALGADTTGNYVAGITAGNGISVSGAAGEGWSPSIAVNYGSIANTAVQGNVTLTCPSGTGNLTGGGTSITLGTGGTCAAISTVNNPSFSTSVTTPLLQSSGAFTLTPAGAMTLGATGQTFTLQGNGTSVITSTTSGFTTTVGFAGVPTANTRYNFDATAAAGTYTICTTAGNCAGNGSTALAGDVTGTTGANTIDKLKGTTVTISSLASGNVLAYNGTAWVNSLISNSNLSSGSYTNITGVGTLAGLTASGTITFSGLNSVGIVTTNASGVLSTGALDRNSSSYFNTALSVANGGTGATTAAGARTNLGAAASGANSDITSLSGLTTALSVGQGGTGAATVGAAGTVAYSDGTKYAFTAAGTSGQCLTSNGAGAPTWGSCTAGAGGTTMGGDVTGTVSANTVSKLQNTDLTITSAAANQTLVYDGTAWKNSLLANANLAAGAYSNITGVGTITSGTWQGTAVGATYGGTGLTSVTTGDLLVGAASNTFTKLAAVAAGSCLVSNGVGAAPVWSSCSAAAGGANTSLSNLTATALNQSLIAGTNNNLDLGSSSLAWRNGYFGTAVYGPYFDTASAGALNLGTTNANALTIGKAGVTTTVNGTVVLSSLTAGLVQSSAGGTLSSGSVDRNSSTFFNTALAVTNGGTGSTTAAGARTNLGAAASGANSDITSLTGLTTDLSVAQGGTGASTFTANGVLYGNGTSALQATAASTAAGQCLITVTAGAAPTWGTCTGDGVGLTAEADTLQTVTGRGSITTIASTFQGGATIRGITVDTATATQDRILISAAATGAARFDGTITNADLTAARTWTLPNASGTIAVSASGNIALSATGNITFTGTLGAANGGTGNTTYTTNGSIYYDGTKFVSTAASTAAGQCLLTVTAGAAPTWGTCTGDGVGITSEADTLATVTGRGATTATASTFSGGLTASGAGTGLTVTNNATIGGTLGVTGATTLSGTLNANGNTTIGNATTDRLTLTAQLLGGAPIVFQGATDNGFATTLALTDPTANNTITLPNASGTVALLGAIALGADTTGNYVAGITAGNGISVSGAAGEGWSPSIAVNYGSIANTAVQGNVTLTCPSGTGNLTGGGTSITLGTGGTCAAISTVNNPSFSTSVTTPLLQSSGAFTLTPAGAMTLGATGQTFTLQGNGTSVITSTTSGFTTTVGFAGVPTANTRYNFDATAAAGTYTICTTAGNCAGNGSTALAGDVTGTTGANTIDKLKGTTVTISSLASGNVLAYNGTAWVNSLISNSNLSSGSYTNITGVGTLAGLTASGTITFSGLNSVGIVTTNASGVLSTGALDRNSSSYFNTALSVANGGTGSTTAAGARTNLGAAASGANSDITSLSGLTTALSVGQGGTGAATVGAAGTVAYSNGTNYAFTAAGTSGQCLTSNGAGAPTWGSCTAGAGGTTMGGDVTGTVSANTVSKLQNTDLTITSAAANQTLVYDGTAWKNSLLANANLAAGAYSNITGVGTITSGTWQGTAVGATYGGTGLTSVTTGDLLVGAASNTFTKLAAVAAGSCLVSNGVGAAPVWSSCSAAAGGANTSLSNLTATALNQSLIAGTNNNLDLGSSSLAWRNGYFGTAVYGPYFDTASAGALNLGTTNANALTIGKAGVTTTVNGTVVLSSLTAGLVQSSAGGTLSSGSVDRNSSTFFNTALAVTNGGTGSTTAAGARTNLGAAASGANSDITSLTGLTTDLSVAQGGTGASTFTANGVLYGNGTSALQATAASTAAGQCLITVTAGAAPTWGTCTGDGVGLTAEADTLQTVTGRGSITTIASTFQGGATIRGITVDTATATQDRILISAAATGAARFDGTITNADLTAARTWTLPNASGTIAVSASGNIALSATGNITFTGTLGAANGGTGNTTYTTNGSIYYDGTKFVSTAASTAAGQCLLTVTAGAAPTWGTCTGDGVGITSEADTLATVTGRGATTATASTFSGGLTASGAGTGLTVTNNATIGGTLGVTGATTLSGTLNANGNTTIGNATTDRLTLTAQLLGGAPIVFQGATDNGFATTLALTDPTANNTITLPNASGTVALLGAIALGADTTGNYVAGITAGNGISVSGAAGEGWSPSIAVNYGSIANTAVQGNVTLTCPSGTGNLTGGGTSITLGTGGTCAAISTVNNPSFSTSVTTPLLQSSGAFTLTPAGAMTLGATGQTFTLQGNGTSVITSTTSGFTTTVGFAGVPTANTRYNFDATAAAGTYTICTTAGNCAGNGSTALAGDVTGTTGANTIDKLKGTTVTISSLASGNVLAYNGTAWVNSLISNSNLSSGSYTNITGVGTLAGLTASGTITFSGLNSVGIVTTNASGVLSTGALDRNSSSYFNTALSVANGGTGATTAAGARTNLGAAASGANSDITSLSGLTTALSVGQGGTGAATAQGAINNLSGLTTNGDILYHNGTNTTRLARGTNGQCLSSTATSIQWASCGLGAEADTLATVTARGATTTVASSFQGGATIRGLTVDSATVTDDIISVAITSTAGSRFTGTITNADLTANRTWTLPDASGTFITTGNLASITGTGTITSGVWNGTALTDAYVSDTLTSSIFRGTGSTTDAIDLGTAEVAGTLADGNVSDTLTIGAAGTVAWGALNAYPAACAAGSAITALGDTITCSAFMTATASNVFVNGGNSFGAAAVLGTNDANSLSLETNGVNRMTIDATGATSFTGSVAAASISTSGNIAATGTISASNFSGSHSGTSSGTNTGDVTVSGQNYITISGQALTVGQINLGGTHVTGTLGVANGGTGSTTAAGARTNLGAAAAGANSDITSLSGLTTALSVGQGGTGAATVGAAGTVAYSDGTKYAFTAAGTSGQCLTSNGAGAPTWGSCTAGVTTVGAISGTSNANGATITGTTINLTPADGTNGGVITNATQTLAGLKTFSGGITSTNINTTAGINTSIGNATGTFTLNSSNIDISSAGAISGVTGYTQASGTATFNQNAADQFRVIALQAPTTDMATISNSGFPVTTAGINGMQIDYYGGAAAVESGAARFNITPGTTSGGTWNATRIVSTAGAAAGVTVNGAKFENTANGAGTENALYFNANWDNIINVNGTSVLTGARVLQNVTTDASIITSGTINTARISGSYTGITGVGTITAGTWNGTAVADAYVADNLTITGGTVDWASLNGYPAACAAGSAVSTLGDTITCTAFATGTTASYIQNQNGSAQATSVFWISGDGRSTTSFTAPVLKSAAGTALLVDSGTTGALNIGTGANAKLVTIGNITGATGVNINSGTGGINIGDNAVNATIDIGGVTSNAANTVNIATNATAADTINVGNSNAGTALSLTAGISAIQMSNNSVNTTINYTSNAYNIQSFSGSSYFTINNSANGGNLITNPSAELNLTGWSARTGTTLTRNTTLSNVYFGAASVQAANTATANAGVNYAIQLSPNTTYYMQVLVKNTALNTIRMGYSSDGATETNYTDTVLGTTGDWTRIGYSVTTPATVNPSAYIFIKQVSATAGTLYLDGLSAQSNGFAAWTYQESQISLGNSGTPVVVGTVPAYGAQATTSAALFVQQSRPGAGLIVQGAEDADLYGDPILAVQVSNGTRILQAGAGDIPSVTISGGFGFYGNAALEVNSKDPGAPATIMRGANGQTASVLDVRDNNDNNIVSVNSDGMQIVQQSNNVTLGAEMYSGNFGAGWTTTNWTLGGGGTTAKHITGNTASLTNTSIAIATASSYQVSFTVTEPSGSGCNTGSYIVASLGGKSSSQLAKGVSCDGTYTVNFLKTTSTAKLAFAPSSTWNGTISGISIKQITAFNDVAALSVQGGDPNMTLNYMGTTGELRLTLPTTPSNSGQIRLITDPSNASNYASVLINDGAATYFKLTAANNPYGNFTAANPFSINNANGRVTIGNGLTVNGTVITNGAVTMNGTLDASNTVTYSGVGSITGAASVLCITGANVLTKTTGGACTNPSSSAYKENINSMADALSVIGSLRPVSFDWKASSGYTAMNGGVSDYGLIAQEVDAILPEVVSRDENGTIVGLKYEGFIPFLLRGMQQQQGQISSLNDTVSALQSIDIHNGGTINGNIVINGGLQVSGNVTVAGNLETADIYVGGHIVTKGSAPVATTGVALGVLGASTYTPAVVNDGTDAAGTVTVTAGGEQLTSGVLAHITFNKAFSQSYKVVVSGGNERATDLRVYVVKTAAGFDIVTRDAVTAGTQYTFDYMVTGAQN